MANDAGARDTRLTVGDAYAQEVLADVAKAGPDAAHFLPWLMQNDELAFAYRSES